MKAPLTMSTQHRHPHISGLDGLRAVAVSLVLVYHLFPPLLPGGYLGVDIFFVISGFLISTLLFREWSINGRINLRGFWKRRARRLLPALSLTLLVSTAVGFVVGGDVLFRIREQVFGALFFVSNWVFIGSGTDYFAQDTPELFRNTWSLAIEEQFYLFLPLAVIIMLRFRSWRVVAIVFTALGSLSAYHMWTMSLAGAAPTRMYFGSDSHVFGLLFGVALAASLSSPLHTKTQEGRGRPTVVLFPQWLCTLVTVLGFVTIGWLVVSLPEGSPQSFEGGFLLATVASLAIIATVSRPGSRVGRLLDNWPMRYVGERSYGIYLWHWPVLIIVRQVAVNLWGPQTPTWVIGVITLTVTLAIAHLSHRYVETPIRKLGFRQAQAEFWDAISRRDWGPKKRFVSLTLTGVFFLTVPLTAGGLLNATETTSVELAIERGRDAAAASTAYSDQSVKDSNDHPDSAEPGEERTAAPREEETLDPQALKHGPDVTAVGDSVMLASAPEITSRFTGAYIDAEVSRGLGYGVSLIDEQSTNRALRPIIVVGLGTNGPIDPEDLNRIHQLSDTSRVILVNAFGDRWWIPEVNEQLRTFADAHRGVVLADWDGKIGEHPEFLAGDLIHPHAEGGQVYAEIIADAIAELETPEEVVGYQVARW